MYVLVDSDKDLTRFMNVHPSLKHREHMCCGATIYQILRHLQEYDSESHVQDDVSKGK